MVKRIFDIVVASAILIVLLPIMALIALAVRARLGSPGLFRQPRPGLAGRTFVLLKFRTMSAATNTTGQLLADESRLDGFGRFLRSTSLDELPELWNVLKGDMSLVGPRPLLIEYLPLYSAEQSRRHEVRPGITGWAQVNGRNESSWEQRFALDVWYVDNYSLGLDMLILSRTLRYVLARKGISHPGAATMPKFRGTSG